MADEVLQEAVVPAFRRARIRLDAQHLFAYEPGEQLLQLRLRSAGECRQRLPAERLAEHGPVLKQAALLGREPVQPGRDQCVQRLGHLERLDLPGWLVDRPLLGEQAAVEQHPHRLHRVEGNALRAGEDLLMQAFRQAWHEPFQ